MPRPARVSPDRILAAAALEFAERGYAGARVDRIARRARVNKAMLYYHFGSKQGLYRTLLARRPSTSLAAQLRRRSPARPRRRQTRLERRRHDGRVHRDSTHSSPRSCCARSPKAAPISTPTTLAALAAVPARLRRASSSQGIDAGRVPTDASARRLLHDDRADPHVRRQYARSTPAVVATARAGAAVTADDRRVPAPTCSARCNWRSARHASA